MQSDCTPFPWDVHQEGATQVDPALARAIARSIILSLIPIAWRIPKSCAMIEQPA